MGFAISAIGLVSFKPAQPTPIKGQVTPAWYGINAWAISQNDTLYTSISDGNFEFPNAEPGVYKIIIEARSPYRHMEKDGIVVRDGQTADVGAFELQKWE